MGKWENAFNANGANAVTLKANFIDLDPDRYKLRLTDPEGKDAGDVKFTQNNAVDTVKVGLSSASDAGNQVTLTETGVNTGLFVSSDLLLVSNSVDDGHPVDYNQESKQDNTFDDRTLKVQLGDMVGMTYTRPGVVVTKQAPVRVIKTVNVHITVMTTKKVGDPGAANNEADGYATRAEVEEEMTKANQQYAQIGVRLVWIIHFADQPKVVNKPEESVDLSNWLSKGGATAASITEEERALILGKYANGDLLRTPETTDVELFVVNKILGRFAGEDLMFAGEAFLEEWLRGHAEIDLVDTAILAWDGKNRFTTPHEIGHLLLNWFGHYHDKFPAEGTERDRPNLMRLGGAVADTILGPKRLWQVQQTAPYGNRPNLIEDYIP